LLPPESGFEPYSLVAFAYGHDVDRTEHLRRSFRYEFGTCCTHLTVEARRRSPWRARMLRDLARAGYEPWLSLDKSADVRRWLRTSAERSRELAFLDELGVHGDAVRWPRRSLRTAPPTKVQHSEARAAWTRAARQICDAGFTWDDVSICLSRFGQRSLPAAAGTLCVTVSVIPYVPDRPTRLFRVSADVSQPSRGLRRRPLPPRVARVFRRVLRAAGFIPDAARSTKDGKLVRGRVGYDLTLTDTRNAARACQQIFDALMTVAVPGPRRAP
jgi:hypothetical protein